MDRRTALVAVGLVCLLAVEVALLALNVASIDSSGERRLARLLHIGGEWTLPEVVQYGKWALLAIILGLVWLASRQPIYAIWAAALGVMALDDSLTLHERIGRVLTRELGLAEPPGYLELVPMAIAGLVVLAALWYAHRRPGATSAARDFSRKALALAVLYAVFAVGVDIAHVVQRQLGAGGVVGDTLMLLLEEGGELISASLLLGYTAWRFRWGAVDRRPEERPEATEIEAFSAPGAG